MDAKEISLNEKEVKPIVDMLNDYLGKLSYSLSKIKGLPLEY